MNQEKIGKFIASLRKEKKLTQEQLGVKIGVSSKTISRWENGNYMPDISLLEILSEQLGVSLLELLRGEKIEKNSIELSDANDYIKTTINCSSNQYKEKIIDICLKVMAIFILVIGVFLIILNIYHIIYLNVNYEYDFDNEVVKAMKDNYIEIQKNINQIKRNQGIYSDDDYDKILFLLEESLNQYKNLSILKYTGVKHFKLNDLYVLDLDFPSVLNFVQIYNLLCEYDDKLFNYYELYKDTYSAISYLSYDNYIEPDISYKYNFFNFNNNYILESRIYHYQYLVSSYLYLTQNIIEVGEINE